MCQEGVVGARGIVWVHEPDTMKSGGVLMKTNLSVGPINHRPRLSFWALTLLSAIWVTRATVAVSAFLQVNWPWILQLLMVVIMSFIYGKWVFAHIHYDDQFYWRVQDDHFCFIDPRNTRRIGCFLVSCLNTRPCQKAGLHSMRSARFVFIRKRSWAFMA